MNYQMHMGKMSNLKKLLVGFLLALRYFADVILANVSVHFRRLSRNIYDSSAFELSSQFNVLWLLTT